MIHKLLVCVLTSGIVEAADWVEIKGGVLRPGIRLDNFEMLDHPVTNSEYKQFIDEAKYPAPVYWDHGRIPAGMEDWPVVFVSRYHDVAAYIKWRTAKEGRIYRLPTMSEFEYAARAGRPDVKYAWGTAPPEGKANYSTGGRNFGQWREFLKPAKSFAPNPWGLYGSPGTRFRW